MSEIYVVTTDEPGREGNICVTDDPDRAKRVQEEYVNYFTFIEVWDMHAEEPKYVTQEHPDKLQ